MAEDTSPTTVPGCRHQHALHRIWAVLAAPGQWSPDTLQDVARILAASGHTLPEGDTFEVTAEVAYDELGWPSATVTVGPLTITASEPTDQIGTALVRIATGEQPAGIHIDVDGHPVWPHSHTAGPSGRQLRQSAHAGGPATDLPRQAATRRAAGDRSRTAAEAPPHEGGIDEIA